MFEHLPSGPRSNLYYGDVSDDEYRRAVGWGLSFPRALPTEG